VNDFPNFYAVIMAGGGGTRLWPMSRRKTPKQMVKLGGGTTLFQMSVNRLIGLFPPERILIVTVAEQAPELKLLAPEIPDSNYLIEPFPRGTASVVGYAAAYLNQLNPDAIMAVLTADHFIQNINEFQNLLISAYQGANSGALITLGIQPTSPSTGFGYIERGKPVTKFGEIMAYEVKKFKEKPSLELAEKFVQAGDHDWNSGMFIWRVGVILNEFKTQMPQLFSILEVIQNAFSNNNIEKVLPIEWTKIIPQTIDYGIMENAKNVIVLPAARLGWNDVGSWDSLFEVMESDFNGNVVLDANFQSFDTQKTLVYSQSGERLIVTIGCENLVIVDTGNALMICDREKTQEVKNVVKYLAEKGYDDYL